MTRQLIAAIERLARPGKLVFLFTLTAGLLLAVNFAKLPIGLQAMARLTHAHILDMSFHYGGYEAYLRLAQLGAAGRALYLKILWTFDLVIPACYALTLATAVQMGWRARYVRHDWMRYLVFIPLLAGTCDYGENLLITFLLLTYPAHHQNVATLAGYFTTAKWLAIDASIALAVLGVALHVLKPLRSPTTASDSGPR